MFNFLIFERQSASGGGAERECVCGGGVGGWGETQNLKQAPGSKLSAQSPTWGLNSQTVRS